MYTGDVDQAGTDCPISLTVFGMKGSSSIIPLEKNGDRFERGRSDLIKVRLCDCPEYLSIYWIFVLCHSQEYFTCKVTASMTGGGCCYWAPPSL